MKYTDLAGLSYSFADEEVEEELNDEEEIGTEYGSDPLIIQIGDDEYIVYDVWGWSGNVVVGYGYVMSYSDNTAHLETGPVLCVVELDDDGDVVNKSYWDAKDADKWNSIEFANKLDEVVSDENLQDLSNALNGLRHAIQEKLDVPWWKPVTAGAVISATAGYLAGGCGPQAIPPAILAALIGGLVGAGEALIRWIENRTWQKRNNFLSNLIIDDLDKTTLPRPI